MRASSWLSLSAALAVLLTTSCTPPSPPPPAPAASEPRALGLRPPTPEERARLDALAPKNPPQEPNALARERLNAERAAQGLPPLPEETKTPPTK